MGVLVRAGGAASRSRGRSFARWFALVSSVIAAGVASLGCEREDGAPGTYAAHGIVEDVDRENQQVLIDHEDVQGLMPGMTMNFAVPEAEVLAGLSRGQVIDFEIRFTGRSYEVSAAKVVGEAPAEAGWRSLGEGLVLTRPVPEFDLIDQAGRAVTHASFPGRVLIVDFIFTECPGPCPVQTSNQVALQKKIPAELRPFVQFLSISLDPETDRPEVLKAYAEARGADLSNWSFLTGEREPVAALVTKWGIGSVRQPDDSIDHTLITFLVQDGRVMNRYTPGAGQAESLLADATALARVARERGAE